uniref:ShKT domain-containing protein n=1 Tax=Globodera pallida TaxID=36090 RepID=A0A183C150_GLOPA
MPPSTATTAKPIIPVQTPTPMPPSTATTPKPIRPVQSCYNEHECCSVWAQKGECQRNQGYMHAWCKASCQQCQPDYDLYQGNAIIGTQTAKHGQLRDYTPKPMPPSTATTPKPIRPVQVQIWAQKGECQRNQGYMHAWCKASCQQCQPDYDLYQGNAIIGTRTAKHGQLRDYVSATNFGWPKTVANHVASVVFRGNRSDHYGTAGKQMHLAKLLQ